jgi:hypothetical protein
MNMKRMSIQQEIVKLTKTRERPIRQQRYTRNEKAHQILIYFDINQLIQYR